MFVLLAPDEKRSCVLLNSFHSRKFRTQNINLTELASGGGGRGGGYHTPYSKMAATQEKLARVARK